MGNNKWKKFILPGSNLRMKNTQASESNDLVAVSYPEYGTYSTVKCVKKCEYETYIAIKNKVLPTDTEKEFIKNIETEVSLDECCCTDTVHIREFKRSEDNRTYQWNDLYTLKAGSILEATRSDGCLVEYEVYPYGSDYYHLYAGKRDYSTHLYHIDEFAEELERFGQTITAAHDPED